MHAQRLRVKRQRACLPQRSADSSGTRPHSAAIRHSEVQQFVHDHVVLEVARLLNQEARKTMPASTSRIDQFQLPQPTQQLHRSAQTGNGD